MNDHQKFLTNSLITAAVVVGAPMATKALVTKLRTDREDFVDGFIAATGNVYSREEIETVMACEAEKARKQQIQVLAKIIVWGGLSVAIIVSWSHLLF